MNIGMLLKEDIVIELSNSGKTDEILDIFPAVRTSGVMDTLYIDEIMT